ncbi:NUDIX hydrolase [Sporosarcina ureilytica]|uniref:NUDIX hydrolase n=1 Tax=Sporosarcina ureilytica TaxID=298596 RepID=UPI00094DD6F7|nr:NUDIX hydrolase [Sporosarcina ureilytica]
MYVNVRAIIEREGSNGTEIVIQKRVKPNENKTPYELPGGRLEEFEPFLVGLKREVLEETGLHVTKILGEETRIETNDVDSNVEAMKPFAVYQTINGPVDSLGLYFRCHASGELLIEGDESEDIKWISVDELQTSLEKELIDFSWVDKSGIMYYLKWYYREKQLNDSEGTEQLS